jgi:MFS family permease
MSFVGDLRTVLRGSGFRRLFSTRLLSQLADGCFQVALGSYVFFDPTKATTPEKAAAAFAVLLLPYSVVGPFAGILLDRWSRQRVLVIVNLVRAVLILGVAGLVAAGESGALFFALALIVISVNRFVLAALSAALPHVVDRDELVMGNSVSTTSGTIVAIIGGGLGLGVRELLGSGHGANAVVMLAAGVVYVAASLTARTIASGSLGPDPDTDRPETAEALRRVVQGLVDGARHIWTHRPAADALAAIAMHRFFYGISTIATVLLYRNYFSDGGDEALGGLAIVVAASGVGYVVAAAVTPFATRRMRKDTWIVTLLLVAMVAEVVFGTPFTQPSLTIAALVLGFVAQGVKICVDSVVQEECDDAFRGRVFSLYDVLFNVAFVSAAAVGVVLLPMSGKSYVAVYVIAAGYGITGAVYGLAVRRDARRTTSTPIAAGALKPRVSGR